jgi:hydroxymethylglutaryl-CoA lyase
MSQCELKIIECPRDAMQGIQEFIPTKTKVDYLNQLLKVGFHTLDFGSFVSPKAIPQLKDTAEVLAGLDLENTKSKLLAIIANERGAKDAVQHEEIAYLGYPFSISETFQQRNTNASIEESLERVARIQDLALKNNKELVIYISMGFGNPYGDPYHEDIVADWLRQLKAMDIGIFALSDTIGVSEPGIISRLFST